VHFVGVCVGDPWLANECLQFADSATQYSVTYYWAVTTITTVGYGDILPNTNFDKTCIMLAMFLSGVLQVRVATSLWQSRCYLGFGSYSGALLPDNPTLCTAASLRACV
jgi:Ion channel